MAENIDADIAGVASIPMVYLGPEPWEGLWRNRHHLMSRFAKDRPVVYVEPPIYLKKLRRQFASGTLPKGALYRARISPVQDNLYLCRTGALCPVSGRDQISRASWRNWGRAVDKLLAKQGIRHYILWISRPTWYPAMDLLNSRMLIYHVVDEYSAYTTVTDKNRQDIQRTEDKILAKADLVIVVSEALLESKRNKTRAAHLVANGVDVDAYRDAATQSRLPASLALAPRPRIGYSGLIAARLDLDLLVKLADERPDYSIVLLGTVRESGCESSLQALGERSNVHFLDTEPVDQVPDYVNGFDLCIIPYARNERAANADPLKLYEYAAAGKEVVCTDFVAARKAGGFCRVADSVEEFIDHADEALSRPTPAGVADEARHWAARNSWDSRVDQVQALIAEHLSGQRIGRDQPEAPKPGMKSDSKRTRILYISPQTGGGSIESLLQLILNLDPEKYSTFVLFERQADESLRARFAAAGATVVVAPKILIPETDTAAAPDERRIRKRVKRHVGPNVVRAYAELLSVWQTVRKVLPRALRMRRVIRDLAPDIVHVNSAPHSGLAGILAARLARVPCVCHVRNMSNVSRIQRLMSGGVEKFIFISSEVQRHLSEQKIGIDNGVVIFNGVDVADFRRSKNGGLRKEIGIEEDSFLVGMVGRLEHWKGHKVFVDAIARLVQEGEKIQAVIVGGPQRSPRNKEYHLSLIDQVRDLELESTIHFLGHRDDVPEIMPQLDLLVLASTEPEPFGRVIIEAMAAETLVVATAGGGVSDIIRDGENGILVPANDANALAAAISAARHEPELSKNLVTNASADVVRRFTASRCADRASKLYQTIRGSSCSRGRRIAQELT